MGLDELVRPERRHAGPVEGVIAEEPASMDDPVWVYVSGLDDREDKIGPCAWTPRGDELPSEGDPCAVAFTDAATPVVTAWWSGRWPADD